MCSLRIWPNSFHLNSIIHEQTAYSLASVFCTSCTKLHSHLQIICHCTLFWTRLIRSTPFHQMSNDHFNIIILYTPMSSKTNFSTSKFVPWKFNVRPISSFFFFCASRSQYIVKRRHYSFPYADFSILLSHYTSLIQIIFSVTWSQTSYIWVFPYPKRPDFILTRV
jgi:hypothetical protein